MKALIITAAGLSSRFRESIGRDELKSIYFDDCLGPQATILHRMLAMSDPFDVVVIVGGYKFAELSDYVERHTPEGVRCKVILACNDHYEDKGSGYSLCVGIDALPDQVSDVLFAEGDLCVDEESFRAIAMCEGDAVSISGHSVEANRSVALYFDAEDHPRYEYDTKHGAFNAIGPFKSIYDSGQIWRFSDADKLRSARRNLSEEQCSGTNLELVGAYFKDLTRSDLTVIEFEHWVNCNTVDDYRLVFGKEGQSC